MRWVIGCFLIVALAGCRANGGASPPAPLGAVPAPTATTPPAATVTPTPVPAFPATTTSVSPTILPSSTPVSSPAAGGWKTYVNRRWQIVLDYPPDWTVQETAGSVLFVSPARAQIGLSPSPAGGFESDLPNLHCVTRTNPYGIVARVCLDTIALSTLAEFEVPQPNGARLELALTTSRRSGDLPVFDAMLATVRPAP